MRYLFCLSFVIVFCIPSCTSEKLDVAYIQYETCSDGIQNGEETGIDCGGTCTPCRTEPNCSDGIQNGEETGIDCGGTCTPCSTEPNCSDGIQNGEETGTDCGGNCNSCDTQVQIPTQGYIAPNTYSGYSLSWSDEFNGNSLDNSKWNYNEGSGCPSLCGWGNNELQHFTDSDKNLYFKEGNLIIEANHNGIRYSSARINTDNKFECQYGRIDIRAAMPSVSGTWVALFLLNKEYSIDAPGELWPSGGEIDVMEYIGEEPNNILGTAHYGKDHPENWRYNSVNYPAQNGLAFHEAYYLYSVVWKKDKITWLVNNIEYHSITPSTTANSGQPYPFNDSFYFIFALSVGGNLTHTVPIADNFPANLIVDYIRVYKEN